MSADERTYIEAKLEMLEEIRSDIKTLGMKFDAMSVQQIATAGRLAIVEEEARKHHCPRAGLCVELEKEITELKSRISAYDSDKKAAFSIWRVVVGVCVFFAGLGAFIYTAIEIGKALWGWFHK